MTDSAQPAMAAMPTPPRAKRPFSRRELVIGAVPVVGAAVAALGALAWQATHRTPVAAPLSPTVPTPAPVAAAIATPQPETVVVAATPKPAATAATPAPQVRLNRAQGLPDGMALVASPRLPVPGVGAADLWKLLAGEITDWRALGAAYPVAARPYALAGTTSAEIRAEQTMASYDELAAALASDTGGLALVPLELVDFRVQTLLVGEHDPLRVSLNGAEPFRIGVVGDIVPGRNVHLHMAQYGDFTRPFLRVAPLLRSFDITVANLEGNLSATLPQPADAHSFSFVSSPAMLDGMALAGIDAVTLANNHTVWNDEGWGLQGFLDTVSSLEAFGMPYFGGGLDLSGARAPWIVEAGGKKIAFMGIDGVTANYEVEPGAVNGVLDFDAGATDDRPGTNPYSIARVLEDVSAATAVADIVIPYFHFGAEYVSIVPTWAAAGARAAIDAGATMVVTNHPHVNQGMEIYAGKPIVYSPGNFIFDQLWATEVRAGYALEIDFRGTAIVGLRFHGVEIEDFHQPRPMSLGEQAGLMDRFWAATDLLAARDGLTG